jgi:hypothetical protein
MTIASIRLTGSGVRARAHTLGRSLATIGHDLARRSSAEGACGSVPAHALRQTRRMRVRAGPKFHPDHVLWGYRAHCPAASFTLAHGTLFRLSRHREQRVPRELGLIGCFWFAAMGRI